VVETQKPLPPGARVASGKTEGSPSN